MSFIWREKDLGKYPKMAKQITDSSLLLVTKKITEDSFSIYTFHDHLWRSFLCYKLPTVKRRTKVNCEHMHAYRNIYLVYFWTQMEK